MLVAKGIVMNCFGKLQAFLWKVQWLMFQGPTKRFQGHHVLSPFFLDAGTTDLSIDYHSIMNIYSMPEALVSVGVSRPLLGTSRSHPRYWLIDWLTDWLINWLIYRLIDWSIDWLIDWLISRLIDWLTDSFINWLIDWLFDWSMDSFIHIFIHLS